VVDKSCRPFFGATSAIGVADHYIRHLRVVSKIDGRMFTIDDGPWTRLTAALAPR
jgi:hypothetical protein